KGGVSDREAVELIAAELAKAGAGAKMAVRFVVITEWHRLAKTKPAVSQDEMEALLGSRNADKKLIETVETYARHHLALGQASRPVTIQNGFFKRSGTQLKDPQRRSGSAVTGRHRTATFGSSTRRPRR